MVNWVEVQRKHLLGRMAKNAGLRQHLVPIHDDAGTVIHFWMPNHNASAAANKKHPVVLVHGFAGDGIMTWAHLAGPLSRRGHAVYVPDLVHFGGSTTGSPDRSVSFQARCLAVALRSFGVCSADVVGFSYGGMVAFAMAAAFPDLVRSVIVTGATPAYTATMNDALLQRLGAGSLTELMLPVSVGHLRFLFSSALHMKMWFPRRLLQDFLKVMCSNRNERAEMLENMVVDKESSVSRPVFQQNILLLWGENDNYVLVEDAKRVKREVGEKVALRSIRKAGHLVHLERPRIYYRFLREFLDHVDALSS